MADLVAGMPAIRLYPGMRVQFEAIDPSTAAAVGGVTVRNVAVYGPDLSAQDIDEVLWPVWLVDEAE